MTLNDWKDSILISCGNSLTSARSSIIKASTLGLGFLIAINAFGPARAATPVPSAPLSYAEVKEHLGPSSKHLNKLYGTENNVIILHNDINLRYIVSNLKKDLLSRYKNPNDPPEKVLALERLRQESGYNSTDDDFKKIQLYTDLITPEGGAFSSFTSSYNNDERPEKAQRIAFFKGWSEYDNNQYSTNFPQYSDTLEQKYFTFFHEITHIVESKKYSPQYSQELYILKTEAIADVATAMIMLRETGNLDDYHYNIRSLRFALSVDRTHMTVDIADAILANVTHKTVIGQDDRALMHQAEQLVNTYVDKLITPTLLSKGGKKQSEANYLSEKHIAFANAYVTEEGNRPFEYDYAVYAMNEMKPGSGVATVAAFSRDAMVASINNLLYHGKMDEKMPHFLAALKNHIKVFNDIEVYNAYQASIKGGKFDPAAFTKSLGRQLDTPAFSRSTKNRATMIGYFERVTKSPIQGFEMTTIKPNHDAKLSNTRTKNTTRSHELN
ncbi:MAG: hypothetical protein RSG77_18305 [Hafnia sp.]